MNAAFGERGDIWQLVPGARKRKRRREEGLFPAAARQTRLELAVFSIM
jgi:hypothetical protein